MSFGPLEHNEYIKLKYLSGGTEKKRRKKGTKDVARSGQFKIIDHDVGINQDGDSDGDEFQTQEEKPQVAAIIDDRPLHRQNESQKNKWRPIAVDDDIAKKDVDTSVKEKEDVSGRYAKTVYRDRSTGRKRNMETEAKVKDEKAVEKEKLEKKYKKWSMGVKQFEDKNEKIREDQYEMTKPLARSADDKDMDQMLREKEVADDPMLDYIRKKRALETEADAKSKGEKVLAKPKYRGPPAPLNRFGIQPGYRWDGVDRSNGFEKKHFERINDKVAVNEEAYKWSTQDM
ncbi:BUD13 -like protein [Halotydeus destructor]|nr:BUD13 -like protein [Halotydeus destructor]